MQIAVCRCGSDLSQPAALLRGRARHHLLYQVYPASLRFCRVACPHVQRSSADLTPPHPTAGGTQYQRLSGSLLEGTDRDEQLPWTFNPLRFFWWILSWAIPGMGMFLEAYFIFRCGSNGAIARHLL